MGRKARRRYLAGEKKGGIQQGDEGGEKAHQRVAEGRRNSRRRMADLVLKELHAKGRNISA